MSTSSVLFLFLSITSILYLGLYVLMFFTLKKHWLNTLATYMVENDGTAVSLLIPFRNEQGNIPNLLRDLRGVVPEHWEVIFIDDHSEDHSFQMLAKYIKENGLSTYKLLSSELSGKKAALSKGISEARSEIIVTTDADIRLPGSNPWRSILAMFKDDTVKLVAGPVSPIQFRYPLAEFQCFEWASVLLVTAASFRLGNPLMCSGANLAFRKSAFSAVGGYSGNDHLLSGDDEFLLKKMTHHFGIKSTRYVNALDATVFFEPHKNLGDLIRQRARWASKWNAHGRGIHYFASVFLFFLAVYPIFTFLFLFAGWIGWLFFIGFWSIKLSVDYIVLGKVIRTFRQIPSFSGLFLTGFLHPLFVLGIGWNIVKGGQTWKGRKIK